MIVLLLWNEVAERHREHGSGILVLDLEGADEPIPHGKGRRPGNQVASDLQRVLAGCLIIGKLIPFRINCQLVETSAVAKVEEVARHFRPPRSAARTQPQACRSRRPPSLPEV